MSAQKMIIYKPTLAVQVEEEKPKLLPKGSILYVTEDGVAYKTLDESLNKESSSAVTNGGDDHQKAPNIKKERVLKVKRLARNQEPVVAIPVRSAILSTVPNDQVNHQKAPEEGKKVPKKYQAPKGKDVEQEAVMAVPVRIVLPSSILPNDQGDDHHQKLTEEDEKVPNKKARGRKRAAKEKKPMMVVPLRMVPPILSSTSSSPPMPGEMVTTGSETVPIPMTVTITPMSTLSERSIEPQTTTPPRIQPRRRRRRSDIGSSALFNSRSPRYPWVPDNWSVEERTRADGRTDKFYYAPTGQMMRSKITALAFMKEQGIEVDESSLKKRKRESTAAGSSKRSSKKSTAASTSGTVADQEPRNNKN